MKHNAILFDLDGTLLDTLEDIAKATNRALALHGFAPFALDFFPTAVGDGARMLIERCLAGQVTAPDAIDSVLAAFVDDYAQNMAILTHPYPGVPELLAMLQAQGIQTAVLSNKPDAMTRQLVERFFAPHPFAIVRGARPDVPRKPDPAAARHIATQMAVDPEAFLYVGDTNTDMQTAVAAGMEPVGVLWGFRSADELTRSGAAHLVGEPMALLPLLL